MKPAGILCLVAIVSFMFVSCGGSSSSSPDISPEASIFPAGTITGKVLSDSSSELLKSFSPVPSSQAPVAGALCSLTGDPSIASATDIEGVFRLSNVPLGVHLILCTKTDPSGKKFAVLQVAEVREGQGIDLGFLVLRQTGQIQGSVIVPGLLDLTGIDVFIPGTSFIAKTDSMGGFTISDIPEGTHTLRAQKDVHRFRDVPSVQVIFGQTINIGVIEIDFNNRTATITSTPLTQATVLTTWVYTITAIDPDEDPLTVSVATGPLGITVTGKTINWTPSCLQVGQNPVTISVADPFGGVVAQSFIVTVVNPNEGGVPENPCRAVTLFEGLGSLRAITVDSANIYATLGGGGGTDNAVIALPLDSSKQGKCLKSIEELVPSASLPCVVKTGLTVSGWPNTIVVTPTAVFWGAGSCCIGDTPSIQTTPLDFSTVMTFASFDAPTNVVTDGTFIYFTSGGNGFGCSGPCTEFTLFAGAGYKIPMTGGTATLLFRLRTPDGQEAGMSFGSVVDTDYIYWTEKRWQISNGSFAKHSEGDAVKRVSKVDGSGLATLVTGLNGPQSIELKGGFLYWHEDEGKAIKRVDVSCAAPCTPITLVSSSKRIIDLEVDDTYVYWIEEGPSGTLKRIPRAGGIPETIATGVLPMDITQDSTYVYWAEWDLTGHSGKIRRALK